MNETIFKNEDEAREYYYNHIAKNDDPDAFEAWLERIDRMGKLQKDEE